MKTGMAACPWANSLYSGTLAEAEINRIKEEAAAKAAAEKEIAVRKAGILCAVKSCHDLGASDIQIKDVLVKNYQLSPAEAEKYL